MRWWQPFVVMLVIAWIIGDHPLTVHARSIVSPDTAVKITLNSVIGDSDERISFAAPTLDAFEPDVAYNPITNQYLVVFVRPRAGGGTNEFEIYGQFVDAATGVLLPPSAPGAEVSGTAFRISRNGNDRANDPFDAYSPVVSYSARDNVFLVAWTADNTNPLIDCANPAAGRAGYRAAGAFEIYVQVVAADGDLLIRDTCGNPQDDRISEINVLFYRTNFAGRTPDWDAFSPSVAYNSQNGEFLICWSDDRANGFLSQSFAEQGGEFEIRCQRFSLDPHPSRRFIGQIGPNDFLISRAGFDVSNPATRPDYDAVTPAIAYNSVDNQWFVVWSADNNTSGVEDGEFEIYGQILAADGTQAHLLPGIGSNYRDDHRISFVGENNGCADASCDAYRPAVAHNPDRNQYLVAWFGDNTNGFEEVYVSLRRPTGFGTSVSNQRVSFSSNGTDNRFKGLDVDLAYDPYQREWLVVWRGDPTVNDRFEIYGQRFNADTDGNTPLTPVGSGNFLIGSTPVLAPSAFQSSSSGLARPLPNGEAETPPSTLYNPVNWHRVAPRLVATGTGRFMTVWSSYLDGVPANRQFEIFGRRLSFVPPTVQSAAWSDGSAANVLNDGDLISGTVNELRLMFAELLRNGNDSANYRLFSGVATTCDAANPNLLASVRVDGATTIVTATAQPLPDGQYSLLACATLTSVGGIPLGSDVSLFFTIDTTAPVLNLPDAITIEATGPTGAPVTFTATAVDAVSGAVAVTCTPASGSTFPLGTTTVTCTATDAAGNTASGSFTVTVGDTTAPTLTLPPNLTREATGPSGAPVTFTATAVDAVSGAVAVTCTPASGSTFPLGTTTVTCTATDAAGNTAAGSFTVTVGDTTAPILTLPPNLTREATGPSGAPVTFTATAVDAVSGAVAVTCTPASGSTFPLGTTTVTCTATDAAGNTAAGSFTITVTPAGAPPVEQPRYTIFIPAIAR